MMIMMMIMMMMMMLMMMMMISFFRSAVDLYQNDSQALIRSSPRPATNGIDRRSSSVVFTNALNANRPSAKVSPIKLTNV